MDPDKGKEEEIEECNPFAVREPVVLSTLDHDRLKRLNETMINKMPSYYVEFAVAINRLYMMLYRVNSAQDELPAEYQCDLEKGKYKVTQIINKFVYVEEELFNEPVEIQYPKIRDTVLQWIYNEQNGLRHSPVYNLRIHSPIQGEGATRGHNPANDMYSLAVYHH